MWYNWLFLKQFDLFSCTRRFYQSSRRCNISRCGGSYYFCYPVLTLCSPPLIPPCILSTLIVYYLIPLPVSQHLEQSSAHQFLAYHRSLTCQASHKSGTQLPFIIIDWPCPSCRGTPTSSRWLVVNSPEFLSGNLSFAYSSPHNALPYNSLPNHKTDPIPPLSNVFLTCIGTGLTPKYPFKPARSPECYGGSKTQFCK